MYISYFCIAQQCRTEQLVLESLSIVTLDTVMPYSERKYNAL